MKKRLTKFKASVMTSIIVDKIAVTDNLTGLSNRIIC